MGRIEENKQQKKQRLMDTAFQLYTTKGITHTSISDIVQAAGVAKGTFYLYFQDKYDLQDKLIVSKAEQLFRHALECSGYDRQTEPVEQVIAMVNDIVDQLDQNHALLRFIRKNLGWGVFSKALTHADLHFLSIFQQILGIQDSRTLTILAYTVIELVSSTCYSVILDGDPAPLQEYRPHLNQAIRAIIRSAYDGQGAAPV